MWLICLITWFWIKNGSFNGQWGVVSLHILAWHLTLIERPALSSYLYHKHSTVRFNPTYDLKLHQAKPTWKINPILLTLSKLNPLFVSPFSLLAKPNKCMEAFMFCIVLEFQSPMEMTRGTIDLDEFLGNIVDVAILKRSWTRLPYIKKSKEQKKSILEFCLSHLYHWEEDTVVHWEYIFFLDVDFIYFLFPFSYSSSKAQIRDWGV